MADPRYKNGVWQGNGYGRRRARPLDSPGRYGWALAGQGQAGAAVYRLEGPGGEARMRRVLPADRLAEGWLVVISGGGREQAWHFAGPLAWITAEVVQLLQGDEGGGHESTTVVQAL